MNQTANTVAGTATIPSQRLRNSLFGEVCYASSTNSPYKSKTNWPEFIDNAIIAVLFFKKFLPNILVRIFFYLLCFYCLFSKLGWVPCWPFWSILLLLPAEHTVHLLFIQINTNVNVSSIHNYALQLIGFWNCIVIWF